MSHQPLDLNSTCHGEICHLFDEEWRHFDEKPNPRLTNLMQKLCDGIDMDSPLQFPVVVQ